MAAHLDERLKQKIRHKLKEYIGEDGDIDLMEDYVGCMVLSEKPEPEMITDLRAFLNDDAETFAQWLTEQLRKRQKKAAKRAREASASEAAAAPEKRARREGAKAPAPTTYEPPPTPTPTRPGMMKKWRVLVNDTKVRSGVDLKSPEVRLLQSGEIVEMTGDQVKLGNGIVRMPITHPSAAEYPQAIGWVTQTAEAVNGPKYLEPGPQPLGKGKGKGWGKGKGKGKGMKGGQSFTNMIWTPGAATEKKA